MREAHITPAADDGRPVPGMAVVFKPRSHRTQTDGWLLFFDRQRAPEGSADVEFHLSPFLFAPLPIAAADTKAPSSWFLYRWLSVTQP